MDIDVVIGANYGDEGKGLATDFLCSTKHKPAVVLTNGGCQRGHTVYNKKTGRKHIFHHFNSGSFREALTYFPNTYYLNPMQFIKELQELKDIGISRISLARHPLCTMQLPSDILVNQSLEKHRGSKRHGSCGWGIFETFLRNNTSDQLLVSEFAQMNDTEKKDVMKSICIKQIQNRLIQMEVPVDEELYKIFMKDSFMQHFIDDFKYMEEFLQVKTLDNIADEDYQIVFENAQGLLLDASYVSRNEDGSLSVYTTPSSCGMNGVKLCIQKNSSSTFMSKIEKVNVLYVTRTYLTRHGAGPLENEDPSIKLLDTTNVHNNWQGTIRFGKHTEDSVKAMLDRISIDLANNKIANAQHNVFLVVTHVNEDRLAADMISRLASEFPYYMQIMQSDNCFSCRYFL